MTNHKYIVIGFIGFLAFILMMFLVPMGINAWKINADAIRAEKTTEELLIDKCIAAKGNIQFDLDGQQFRELSCFIPD